MDKKEFKKTISYERVSNDIKMFLFWFLFIFVPIFIVSLVTFFYLLETSLYYAVLELVVISSLHFIFYSPLLFISIYKYIVLKRIIRKLNQMYLFRCFIRNPVEERRSCYKYIVSLEIDGKTIEKTTEWISEHDTLKNKECKFGYLKETNTLLVLETSYKYLDYNNGEISNE